MCEPGREDLGGRRATDRDREGRRDDEPVPCRQRRGQAPAPQLGGEAEARTEQRAHATVPPNSVTTCRIQISKPVVDPRTEASEEP